jgi:hypothetical protein
VKRAIRRTIVERAILAVVLASFIMSGFVLAHHSGSPGCERITFVSEQGFSATFLGQTFGPFGEGQYPTDYTYPSKAGSGLVQFYDREGKAEKSNEQTVAACPVATPRPTPKVTGNPPPTPKPHRTLPPTDT